MPRLLETVELHQLGVSDEPLGANPHRPATPHDESEPDAQSDAIDESNPANGRGVLLNTARSREYCVHDDFLKLKMDVRVLITGCARWRAKP